MKTIVIAGAHSGVGKTTLAEVLLRRLKGWSALKVTVTSKNGCPHNRFCGTCNELKEPYKIITDYRIINTPRKDTYRFKKAGARQVIWLISQPGYLKEGLKQAFSGLKPTPGIIIEGRRVLRYIKPNLVIWLDKTLNSCY